MIRLTCILLVIHLRVFAKSKNSSKMDLLERLLKVPHRSFHDMEAGRNITEGEKKKGHLKTDRHQSAYGKLLSSGVFIDKISALDMAVTISTSVHQYIKQRFFIGHRQFGNWNRVKHCLKFHTNL